MTLLSRSHRRPSFPSVPPSPLSGTLIGVGVAIERPIAGSSVSLFSLSSLFHSLPLLMKDFR